MEDIMDYDATHGTYRQQPPLRPPPNLPPPTVHASVSPRFENLMARSSSVPWSPAPLDSTQYDRSYQNPLSVNHAYTKSTDVWTNSNSNGNGFGNNSFPNEFTRTSEAWKNNNGNGNGNNNFPNDFPRTSEPWKNNNSNGNGFGNNNFPNDFTRTSEPWKNNNRQSKTNDMHMNYTSPQNKINESWSPTHTNSQTKPSDLWSPSYANTRNKPLDAWSPDTFTKKGDSFVANQDSSNMEMIKSSNKKSGFITDRCSPRCKLGLLGFTIGFLLVGIAIAVVLVLWLRK